MSVAVHMHARVTLCLADGETEREAEGTTKVINWPGV